MNLSLVAIEVEAFKNFAARTRVELGDLLPGLHFVRGVNRSNDRLGSNGAGKTTLFSDAVTWCWYGRTIGGLRTTDVRSWLTEKSPRVATVVRCDATVHTIQRGPRATDLTIDGRTAGQEDVDALVGVTFEAWKQAVVWGQGQPLFLDLPPRDKMGLLAGALGLERWERRAEAASARARALEASLVALEGELRGLEAARGHAGASLVASKAATETWGREHAERLEGLKKALGVASKTATAAEDERGREDVAGEEVAVKVKLLRPDVEKARGEARDLESAAGRLDGAVLTAQDELAKVDADIASFRERGICPTCGQVVSKAGADKHVRDLKKRSAALRSEINTAEGSLGDTEHELGLLKTKLEEDEAALAKLEALGREQASALLTLERRAAQTLAEANAAEAALKHAEEERNPHRDAAQDARKRLREIDAELAGGDERAEKLAASAERASFWTKGFREIRLMVVDDVVDDLRATTAAMLEGLGLGDWGVDYATERETQSGTTQRALIVAVRAPGTPENVRWESYSGGEGQRLRLASALALGEVLLAHAGVRVDFRVLDEPTRGLSREGVRDLTDVLAEYAEGAGIRLFYVDHQSSEGLTFRSTLTITSDIGGARVEAG